MACVGSDSPLGVQILVRILQEDVPETLYCTALSTYTSCAKLTHLRRVLSTDDSPLSPRLMRRSSLTPAGVTASTATTALHNQFLRNAR
jgi:hypothetical protein